VFQNLMDNNALKIYAKEVRLHEKLRARFLNDFFSGIPGSVIILKGGTT
jgi:hypothetical protein